MSAETSIRAAYWISDDEQGESLLTAPEHSHLGTEELLCLAELELLKAGIDLARDGGRIEVGDWVESTEGGGTLLAWRLRELLTQARAASIAGVDLRSWQRWEAGDRGVPQWLADVLAYRWGNGP